MNKWLTGLLLIPGLMFVSSFQFQAIPKPHLLPGAPPPTLTPEQAEILSHMSLVFLPDGQGGTVKTIRISRINVQVVNGTNITTGGPNGVGNLIIGYNELGNLSGVDDRTGSHNLVLGERNTYRSVGGLVGGSSNELNNLFSSVVGGQRNSVNSQTSVVVGGNFNRADGFLSSVTGGQNNVAFGSASVVTGGEFNAATGTHSVVSGGQNRSAGGNDDWVAGTLFEDN